MSLSFKPSFLDPKRPKSWGREVSTAPTEWAVEELPVRLSILVHDGRFAGLRGPNRILGAIYDHYLVEIDPYGITDDPELNPELAEE